MTKRATQHVEQYFVAEEVSRGLYRLFASHDFRPQRGFRYRVVSSGPDIWAAIATFGGDHRNAQGLITIAQLQRFIAEQRAVCDIEEVGRDQIR